MVQEQNTWLQRCVEGVLSAQQIEETTREHGVIVRQRKLDVVLFVRTLVLGFGAASGRVVAIRSDDGEKWHRYVTNAPPEMLRPSIS